MDTHLSGREGSSVLASVGRWLLMKRVLVVAACNAWSHDVSLTASLSCHLPFEDPPPHTVIVVVAIIGI